MSLHSRYLIEKTTMILFQQAVQIVLAEVKDFGTEKASMMAALGRILREDLIADREFPPYDRVTMDGIAFQFDEVKKSGGIFKIEGVAAAGAPEMTLQNDQSCLETMTGSILPKNTDTVIRYEDVLIENGIATLQVSDFKKGKNIHRKGSDRSKGSLLVKAGKRITAAEIGVAATVGKTHLAVSRLPKVSIIGTGDELVEVATTPLAHQIRKSNSYSIQAALLSLGIPSENHHLNDDLAEVTANLKILIADNEVLILSGGVSKGKFDYLPAALESLGVEKLFHKVRQRPGKPFWFGKAQNGTLIFALPGNPVSSFMCTHRYVLPFLKACLQLQTTPQPMAVLTQNFTFKPDLTYFLQVKIFYKE
ncbi:MAG: molybdopterin molybdotransferase, partial [Saprospiraceae bacterium]